MNIQAMMKQAQKLQKDMMMAKDEINQTIYTGKSSFVDVEVMGTKQIKTININKDLLDKDDIELVEDMLIVAINEANSKIDSDTETKLGKYTQGMPGLF